MASKRKDPFDMFGNSTTSNVSSIFYNEKTTRKIFRKMLSVYHPDNLENGNEELFKIVNEVYILDELDYLTFECSYKDNLKVMLMELRIKTI